MYNIMGVTIYACKLKERVCSLKSENEFEDYLNECEEKDISFLRIYEKDYAFPFEEGVYLYESGKSHCDMSYSGNGDFRDCLEQIGEEVDEMFPFSTTLMCGGIDGCVSYEYAEDMLEEFEKYKNTAKNVFIRRYGEDYGCFLIGQYNAYMDVLRECIDVKGVVRYH